MVFEEIEIKSISSINNAEELEAKGINWYTLEPYLGSSWLGMLYSKMFSEEMVSISAAIRERKSHSSVYPSFNKQYNAFKMCHFDETKVVILGEEPYDTPEMADGLAFSTMVTTLKCPEVLKNILTEVEDDVYEGFDAEGGHLNYSLERWAKQGVFLLNTSLTVERNSSGTHTDIWEPFTNEVIDLLNNHHNDPIVFLLWGKHAQSYKSLITNPKHLVLEAGHPSKVDGFEGCKHFSKANKFIKDNYGEIHEIKW